MFFWFWPGEEGRVERHVVRPLAVHEGFGEDVGEEGDAVHPVLVCRQSECVQIGKEVKRRKELALEEDVHFGPVHGDCIHTKSVRD